MSLSDTPGKRINKYVKDYCVFDLETTGISLKYDEVVEISAVKVVDGQVIDEFSTLVNPGMPIPYMATEVNGITNEMVENAPTFEVALKEFLDFAGDCLLLGHNIHAFDMKFIMRDAERYWGMTIGNDYIDTLPIAKAYLPGMCHYTLTDLAKHYDIKVKGAHRALSDCRMNQKIYECLGKEIENPSEDAKAVPKCPKCGNILKLRDGKYGVFWGCTGYPECKFTRNATAEEKKKAPHKELYVE